MDPLFSADSTPTVFVSHAAKDGRFVKLLAAVLQFHDIHPSSDAAGLSGASALPAPSEDALCQSDALVVVVSRHTADSPHVAEEILRFTQRRPEPIPVVPLMLAPEEHSPRLPELGEYRPVDFSDSLSEGFHRLLQVFGRPFLRTERRRTHRRIAPDQGGGGERRVGPPARRLRQAFRASFYHETGISERQDFDLSVVNLHKTIDALREESQRYEYRDGSGARIDPTEALERAVQAVWKGGYGPQRPQPAVLVIEAVAEELAKVANPRSRDRRSGVERRSPLRPK